MDQGQASPGLNEADAPPPRRCAFCDAPFTARMTAWMGEPRPCACCEGAILSHWPIKPPPPIQTEDLACDACGRVLYRAPGAA
jgi:hypothetical protein